MTFEARLAFVAFFLLCWCIVGLIPWALVAVWVRGRGALPALPLALASACAAGILVPLLGQRDARGYFLSLATALVGGAIGSAVGIAFSRRLSVAKHLPERPAVPHPIGAPRPVTMPSPTAESPEQSNPRTTSH